MKKTKSKGQAVSPTTVGLIVIILILGVVGYLSIGKNVSLFLPKDSTPIEESASEQPTVPTISPTPIPISQGLETYSLSWGEGTTVPKLTKMTVDPHDPKEGQTQTIRVTIAHTKAIESMSITIKSDTQSKTYPMKLVGGSPTDGVWEGSWASEGTHKYTYQITPKARVEGKDIPYDIIIL